jgi:hypothetical protein
MVVNTGILAVKLALIIFWRALSEFFFAAVGIIRVSAIISACRWWIFLLTTECPSGITKIFATPGAILRAANRRAILFSRAAWRAICKAAIVCRAFYFALIRAIRANICLMLSI